jgi:solute carrier family 25 carnitine/acylcarnitine transporter 20/29
MSSNNDTKEVYIDLFAGWASGAVSIFCSQPIDTVLTRIQANKHLVQTKTSSTTKSLVGNYGIKSLWRGSSAMIGAIPFQNALMMAGYGYGKRWCENRNPNEVLMGVFIGGCCGGVAQSFLMSPVELIKVNQQVIGKSLSSATAFVASGMLERKVAWRGLEATLLRDGIPHGVWFASYEWSKNYLEQMNDVQQDRRFKSVIPLFCGAFAAFTAWAVGYPFDIIKTKIQAVEGSQGKTVMQATKEILEESNGRPFRALYRGFGLKICKAVPASAINFFVYESVAEELRGN